MRLMPQSIIRSFQASRKKHLLITGSRGSGKSTLARSLAQLLGQAKELPALGITTFAVPGQSVVLQENRTGRQAVIGRYVKPDDGDDSFGGCMQPVAEALEGFGREALLRCSAGEEGSRKAFLDACGGERAGEWAVLDELGYLESGCEGFCEAVRELFGKKRVLAVLRKQQTAFLDELRAREDVFLYDLDEPVLPVGCIIMASGLGRRFGGNKLLARLGGKTLLEYALEQTGSMGDRRVVVTRHPQIAALCQEQNAECVLHGFPERNDTVRVGVEYLQKKAGPWAGYLFCPADQPLLRRETLETLVLEFSRAGLGESIFRLSCGEKAGAPVLFGQEYGQALQSLPQGTGGSWLARKYPQNVRLVEAKAQELWDVDTPKDLEACRQARMQEEAEG